MALAPTGSDHCVAGIIHVQIVRDTAATDPSRAFFAQINAPDVPQQSLPLNDAAALDFPVKSGQINGTIHAEVDDFTTLPGGAAADDVTAIACRIVFKLKAVVFSITIGSIHVTAALK